MHSVVTGNQGLLKQLNKWLVLNTIRQTTPVSRADVARRTGLNSATVSHLVAELLEDRLIEEVGHGDSRGGRRPVLLRVNPSALFAVGLEINSVTVRMLVVNLAAGVMERREWPLDTAAAPGDAIVHMSDRVREVLHEAGIRISQVMGVGVTAPGLIDYDHGCLLHSANLPGWQHVPLKELLEEQLGAPVVLERDAIAAAVGELWHGAGRGSRDLIFLLVDMGVGAGVVVGGQVQRGAHGGAGEVGHMTVDIAGPRCNCGNYGCLESFASGVALRRRMGITARLAAVGAADGLDPDPDLPTILAAARAGHQLAEQLLAEAGRYLGLALANIINLYDPEVVVLGGTIPLASPGLVETITTAANTRALKALTGKVRVVPPHFGHDACAAGAATLAMERFFDPVQIVGGRR